MNNSRFNLTTVTLDHAPTKQEIAKTETAYRREWADAHGVAVGDEIILDGDASLADGESEARAHTRVTRAMRAALGVCAVQTRWVYLEEVLQGRLPSSTYLTAAGEPTQSVVRLRDAQDDSRNAADQASGGCTANDAEARP